MATETDRKRVRDRESIPQEKNLHLIWTVLWHLNSHFAEVALVFHKTYITLGLWEDDGWDFTKQLEFIKETLVYFVDVSAKIEVALRKQELVLAGVSCLQSLTLRKLLSHKVQHTLTLASWLLRELAYIIRP